MRTLNFDAADDLAMAIQLGRLEGNQTITHIAREFSPLAELSLSAGVSALQLVHDGWISLNEMENVRHFLSLEHQTWIDHANKSFGFLRVNSKEFNSDDPIYVGFLLSIQQAAAISGLSVSTGKKLVGAIKELESNIYEHSQRASTGMLAFSAKPDLFELLVADKGIGVLESFRGTERFDELENSGDALQLATRDGVSRLSDEARGFGFRQFFQALTDMSGHIRLRSGDFALTISQTAKHEGRHSVKEKPRLDGFSASVQIPRPGSGYFALK